MFRKLIATDNDTATTILRLVLGVIFFAHGAQKMLGWFGGYGFTGTMGFFTGVLHIPAVFAFLAIAAEFFGGLGLIFGLLTRVASFGVSCNMIVAVAMVHGQFGFWMNWTGAQKGEGYEYHLLLLAASALLMIRGAGAASVDRLLSSPANNRIRPGSKLLDKENINEKEQSHCGTTALAGDCEELSCAKPPGRVEYSQYGTMPDGFRSA